MAVPTAITFELTNSYGNFPRHPMLVSVTVMAKCVLENVEVVCPYEIFMDHDMSHHYRDYALKRARIVEGLRGFYEFTEPGGAFYIFPKVPSGTATEFVRRAVAHELLVIPGNIFSARDTHFRISFAASDEMLDRGIEVLRKLAAVR
jgi:aspartate/methionine/tyrosine aminotransferase